MNAAWTSDCRASGRVLGSALALGGACTIESVEVHRNGVSASRTTIPGPESRASRSGQELCRPTREPRAPFVAGPPGPRVASAPRVLGAASARAPARCHVAVAARPGPEEFLALFERRQLTALREAIEARGGSIVVLRDEPVVSEPWSRGFDRAALVAAIFGVIGAVVGALLGRGEVSLPVVGWLPTSVVAAAAFAGGGATFAFTLAFLLDLVAPAPRASRSRVLCVVRGVPLTTEARALGGEVLALLPRRA